MQNKLHFYLDVLFRYTVFYSLCLVEHINVIYKFPTGMNTKNTVLWNVTSRIMADSYKGLGKVLLLNQIEYCWSHKWIERGEFWLSAELNTQIWET